MIFVSQQGVELVCSERGTHSTPAKFLPEKAVAAGSTQEWQPRPPPRKGGGGGGGVWQCQAKMRKKEWEDCLIVNAQRIAKVASGGKGGTATD